MIKIVLCGAGGKMGCAVASKAAHNQNMEIIAGVDAYGGENCAFAVYRSFDGISQSADVVIDFSRPDALNGILGYVERTGAAAVLASTGYSSLQLRQIDAAAQKNAIFKSANLSLGINLLLDLCRRATAFLGEDYDIEIIEKHHNKKVDAPSGTALLLADGISEQRDNGAPYIMGRQGNDSARKKGDIGIHAVRGGNIVGEHQVDFIGQDEIITLIHSASSKEVFASGALRAAEFVYNKPAGLYTMDDIVKQL